MPSRRLTTPATKQSRAKKTKTSAKKTKTSAKKTRARARKPEADAKTTSSPRASAGPRPMSPRPFAIRSSPIAGKGAFATQRIPKGARIIEYVGEHIDQDEADRRYPMVEGESHHTFLFNLEDGVVVDAAVGGNVSRFINHSCDPNCEAVIEDGRIWIFALKTIPEGTELGYDYRFILDEPHTPAAKREYPCLCGARTCRGTILAKKR